MSTNREEMPRSKAGVLTGDDSKLEWLYKSGSELLNREEYLLGRKIDKQFEQLDEEEVKQKSLPGVTVPKNHVEHECIPFSIRSYRGFQSDEQVDMSRKIMEDPLMMIRQKEMESRRRILENPVKLKELHRLLKEQVPKKCKESKKKSKKKKDKKRSKKRRNSASSSSSSDNEDLDKLLAKKYRQIREEFGANDGTFNLKKLLGKEGEKLSSGDGKHKRNKAKVALGSDSEENESTDNGLSPEVSSKRTPSKKHYAEDARDKRFKYNHKQKTESSGRSRRRCRSVSSDEALHGRSSDAKNKSYQSTYRNKNEFSRNRSEKCEKQGNSSKYRAEQSFSGRDKHSDSRESRSDRSNTKMEQNSKGEQRRHNDSSNDDSSSSDSGADDTHQKRNYGLVTAAGKKIELKRPRMESPGRSQEVNVQSKASQQRTRNIRKEKLTDEEKERRCREMMENAVWRDKERKSVVEKYRKEYERESDGTKKFDRNFINKEMLKAMKNQTSVESRLKSNINNIQRSGRAMETNFAKR